jgi:uncharacterized protein (TIGR00251 family)
MAKSHAKIPAEGLPPAPLSLPPCLRAQAEGAVLAVYLQPRASVNEIGGLHGAGLRVRVTAPPVDSAANEALIRLLAERLDCGKSAIRILRGHTSRHKQLLFAAVTASALAKKLASIHAL